MNNLRIDEFQIDDEVASSMLELENSELESFAELYESLTDDDEIELSIFICFLLYQQTGRVDWADRSIRKSQRWAASTPLDHGQYKRRYQMMASLVAAAMQNGHKIDGDRELETKLMKDLLEGARFKVTGSAEDIADTINFKTRFATKLPPGFPGRVEAMVSLARWHVVRFQMDKQSNTDDLQQALGIIQHLIGTESTDDVTLAELLVLASQWLKLMYECDKDLQTLGFAIDAGRQALALTSEFDASPRRICTELAEMLMLRAVEAKNPAELHEANAVLETSLQNPTLDQSGRVGALNSQAVCAAMLFSISEEYEHLDRAIDYIEMALTYISVDSVTRKAPILNLIQTLQTLTKGLNALGCRLLIDRAIKLLEGSLNEGSWNDFPYYETLIEPARLLAEDYGATKDDENLEKAIKLMDIATKWTPSGVQKAKCLCKSSEFLQLHFEHTGTHQSLDQAVQYAKQAVDITPLSHPDRSHNLTALGSYVTQRAQEFSRSEDAYHAVRTLREASEITPPTDPGWLVLKQNLSSANLLLFTHTGNKTYLTFAIEALEQCLSEHWIDKTSPQLNEIRCNLAILLCSRSGGSKRDMGTILRNRLQAGVPLNYTVVDGDKVSLADIDRALKLMHAIIGSIDKSHREWGLFHKHLGVVFHYRFMIFLSRPDLGRDAMPELDLAISAMETNLESTPLKSFPRGVAYGHIAVALLARTDSTNNPADQQKLLDCLREGSKCPSDSISQILLDRLLGMELIKSADYTEASQVLEKGIRALPVVCSRSSSIGDKQGFLRDCYNMASIAAGASLSAGNSLYHALEVLEAGRGIVAGLFLDTRMGVYKLRRQHPDLASKFQLIGEQLNADPFLDKNTFKIHPRVDDGGLTQSDINHRVNLQKGFDELVEVIRQQHGFEDFLLPASTDEMMIAASDGPIVVINVSTHRCDAIIIERHQIGSVPLPHISFGQVETLARKLQNSASFETHSSNFLLPLLEWLWVVAARPILEYLNILHPPKDDCWPHIWWIPTASFTHFPIHAAGLHGRGSNETVMDRAISSYASSVKSLIHSRQKQSHEETTGLKKALLVSVSETPHQSSLPFVDEEVNAIKPFIHGMGLTPVLCQKQETTNEILQLMKTSKILHFAGHGMSHAINPSESCLLTVDWESNPLTVGKLRQQSLQGGSPFLAYLSSCSTAAVRSVNMADESMHLINSCQLAGFRHVIGALWEVSDAHCVQVARSVYEHLDKEGQVDEAVAKGLHIAVRRIRDSSYEVTRGVHSSPEKNDPKCSLEEQLDDLDREFRAFGIFDAATCNFDKEDRDAVPIETRPHRKSQPDPYLWVPYVHYGA